MTWSGNGDGFIRGPVLSADGVLHVNDRLAVISYNDLVPRIMDRVARGAAQEMSQALDEIGDAPGLIIDLRRNPGGTATRLLRRRRASSMELQKQW